MVDFCPMYMKAVFCSTHALAFGLLKHKILKAKRISKSLIDLMLKASFQDSKKTLGATDVCCPFAFSSNAPIPCQEKIQKKLCGSQLRNAGLRKPRPSGRALRSRASVPGHAYYPILSIGQAFFFSWKRHAAPAHPHAPRAGAMHSHASGTCRRGSCPD